MYTTSQSSKIVAYSFEMKPRPWKKKPQATEEDYGEKRGNKIPERLFFEMRDSFVCLAEKRRVEPNLVHVRKRMRGCEWSEEDDRGQSGSEGGRGLPMVWEGTISGHFWFYLSRSTFYDYYHDY